MEQVDKSKLFKYTKEEDYLNYVTHGLGAVLSIVALVYLMMVHRDVTIVVKFGIIIYCLSMCALFSASALYHKEQDGERRATLKRLDHAMILVMISGTYAPLCLLMATPRSYLILGIVYVLSVIGIALKVKFINVRNSISILIYLIVGWLAIFMLKDMLATFDPTVLVLIVLGGLIYSIGALIYAFTNFKYQHALWHMFVLVAAIAFFFAIDFAL